MGAAYAAGLPMDAVTTMLATLISLWACTLGQLWVLDRRLGTLVERGPKGLCGAQLAVHLDAEISLVEGFYTLLTY